MLYSEKRFQLLYKYSINQQKIVSFSHRNIAASAIAAKFKENKTNPTTSDLLCVATFLRVKNHYKKIRRGHSAMF